MGRRAHGEGAITERPDGTWMGQVTTGYDDSKRKRRTVYGKTQKEVGAKLAEIKQQLANGTLSNTKLTVKDYLERWLKEKERQVKPRTIASYRYSIDKYINPRIGSVKLDKLTPMKAQAAIGEIADTAGARTANLCRTMLFSAMKQAVRWRVLPYNPIEGTTRVKEGQKEMVLWTSSEAVRFLEAAHGHRLYPLFYLAMSAGLRCGELLGLQWTDLKSNVLTVRRTLDTRSGPAKISTPKSEKGKRRVMLAPDVTEVLEQHHLRQEAERQFLGETWPATGHVFVSEAGTLLNARNVTRVSHWLQDKAGVPRARLHDSRHLHVSMLIRSGVDPRTVADRIGHTDASFTLRKYAHCFEEQRHTAALNLRELLGSGLAAESLN
jgi:integrase